MWLGFPGQGYPSYDFHYEDAPRLPSRLFVRYHSLAMVGHLVDLANPSVANVDVQNRSRARTGCRVRSW